MAVREIAHAFLNAGRPEEVFQFALDRVCAARRRHVRVRLRDRGRLRADEARGRAQLAAALRAVSQPDAGPRRLRAERRGGKRAADDRGARHLRRSVIRGLARGRDGARLPRLRRPPAPDQQGRPRHRHLLFPLAESGRAGDAPSRAHGRRPNGGDGREVAADRRSAARQHRALRDQRRAAAAVRGRRRGAPDQGRLSRQHLARAADPAHGGDRLHRAHAGRRGGSDHRRAATDARAGEGRQRTSADAHWRSARPHGAQARHARSGRLPSWIRASHCATP